MQQIFGYWRARLFSAQEQELESFQNDSGACVVHRVGVSGGGFMGSGIAWTVLLKSKAVVSIMD